MKLQVAFEYMIIVGIVIAFIIPVWLYISGMQYQTSNQLSISYAKNTVERIVDTCNLVYSQGPPAKVNLNVYIPNGVEEINIINKTLIFKIRTSSGVNDIFSISTINLNGTLPIKEGTYWINVEAKTDFIQINPI